ncbi:MAG: helix-turn-helix transcriptional regulator, partial [Bacteroidales bacterium]|nr:helix-turn-helix transcriptional regulator [Bacteroidales bacterium]
MNTRLQQFLTLENLTPARLADILGVQRSGMSHILSGRNKPGYDFIFKLCTKFPHLNANWFITGKGKPYKDSNAGSESESPSALSGNNS